MFQDATSHFVSLNRSTYHSFSSSSPPTPNAHSSHIGFRATDAGYPRRSGATKSNHVISKRYRYKGSWNSFQIEKYASPSILLTFIRRNETRARPEGTSAMEMNCQVAEGE
jgi:hypothetical protein